MTASGGLYPALGKHFKNMTELAHAGNIPNGQYTCIIHGNRLPVSEFFLIISAIRRKIKPKFPQLMVYRSGIHVLQ